MYCRLCLYQAQILIPMRDEGGNVSTDILGTVEKYIGVQLTSENCICVSCWSSVDNFRKFCLLVAERQAQYAWSKEVAQQEDHENNIKTTKDTSDCLAFFKLDANTTKESKESGTQQGSKTCEQESQLGVEATNIVLENSLENISVSIKNAKKDNISCVVEIPQKLTCNGTSVALSEQESQETILKCAPLKHTEKLDLVVTFDQFNNRKLGRPRRSDAENQTAEDQLIASHMQLVCDVCKCSVDCFKALKDHFRNEHNSNGYVVCCQKRLYKRGILIDHINVHRNAAYFSCASCAINFADRLCLRNHTLLKHQQATESPHECTICGTRFAKVRFLQRHMLKHATEDEQRQCTLCSKSYPNATRLQAHIKLVHNDGDSLNVCAHCGIAVSGKQCFARHLAQHGTQTKKASAQRGVQRVQCNICGQWLAHKSSLRLHMQKHEDLASVYACELCGKEAATRIALNAHKRLCHASEQRQHVCNVCTRAFSTTRRLREHMTTHTGEHLYRCNFCDKRFKCSSNLHAHRKWKHPAEWAQDQHMKAIEGK